MSVRTLALAVVVVAVAAPLPQSLHVVAEMAKGDALALRTIVPFLAMMGFGSWGLSQFLKMPTQMKDARAKDRRANRQKFDLEKENERLQSEMQETLQNYENVRVPGPRRTDRVAAD